MKKVLLLGLCLLLGAMVIVLKEAYTFLQTPPEKEGRDLYFDVGQGKSLTKVASQLEEKGLITNARYFVLLARFRAVENKLQAGRFLLHTAWNPEKVLETLVHGKPVLYRITLPEGLTMWQTAALLAENGFVNEAAFLEILRDPAFLRHFAIPFATAEGFLMPDTYLLKREEQFIQEEAAKREEERKKNGESGEGEKKVQENNVSKIHARKVASRLVDAFWRKADSVWEGKKRPSSADLRRYVILASIVEKETNLSEERRRVAGVYQNRLDRNMLLQADPTVIYGLGPAFKGRLLFRHLDDQKNPYNTYKKAGLPPGPICSFGISALKAALSPEKHSFLYFVARANGAGHTFSKSLEEHNRAVQEYRRAKRDR